MRANDSQTSFSSIAENGKLPWDTLVAIERTGRAVDGHYYTMRGRDMSHLTAPIDDLFLFASQKGTTKTIGIGDGGNELGMGKVVEVLHARCVTLPFLFSLLSSLIHQECAEVYRERRVDRLRDACGSSHNSGDIRLGRVRIIGRCVTLSGRG